LAKQRKKRPSGEDKQKTTQNPALNATGQKFYNYELCTMNCELSNARPGEGKAAEGTKSYDKCYKAKKRLLQRLK
jgi:hypothetical protein